MDRYVPQCLDCLMPNFDTGRRLAVRNGDLQNAFHQLNLRLRQNHVAKENALTVRHEKKGDKRARLRSERWRKRFADAACTDFLPSCPRILTTLVPVGQEKGTTGQYDTSAGWLSEAVHAFKTVCYTILNCYVNGDGLASSCHLQPSLPDFPRVCNFKASRGICNTDQLRRKLSRVA